MNAEESCNIIKILEYHQKSKNTKSYSITHTTNFMMEILHYLRSNVPALIVITNNVFQTCNMLDELDGIITYEICNNWNKFIVNHGSFLLHNCYFNSKRMVILVKYINFIPEFVVDQCQIINQNF